MPRRGWRGVLPYLGAGIGGFVLAYALVAFMVFPPGAPPQDGKIPNVMGLTFDAAAQRLQQAGFHAERGEMRLHEAAPRLTVVQQTPQAGSVQPLTSGVTLDLSAGTRLTLVPDVVGLGQQQADSALQVAGFVLAQDVMLQESDQPRGTVLSTKPEAGTKVSAPSTVVLTVSAGPANVSVPDVTGRTVEEARVLLEQVGLTLGDVTVVDGSELKTTATTVTQTPAAGTAVVAGSHVNLSVSGVRKP